MKTIRTLVLFCLLGARQLLAQVSYGEIRGLIKGDELEPVIGAVVQVTQGGVLIGGTSTGVDGKYKYKPLNPGKYDIVVTSPAHATYKKTGVKVQAGESAYVDIKMSTNTLMEVTVSAFTEPIIDIDLPNKTSMDAEEFMQSASRGASLVDMIGTRSAEMVKDNSGEWHMRGARSDATEYIIDGIRVQSMNGVPNLAVENLSVISGGIPAMYGDLTSGVIIVTTKDYFTAMREKRIRENVFYEREELRKRQQLEKRDNEWRQKEIEQEKLNDGLK